MISEESFRQIRSECNDTMSFLPVNKYFPYLKNTLLAQTSHVISAFHKAMQSCIQSVTECHKRTAAAFYFSSCTKAM